MLGVYVGKNSPNASVYLVGQQMAKALGARLVTKQEEFKGLTCLINLLWDEQEKLLAQRRFGAPRRQLLYLAGDADEWTSSQFASTFLTLGDGLEAIVANSKHTYSRIEWRAKQLLNPMLANRLMQQVECVPWAVEDIPYTEQKSNLKWLAPFNRVNVGTKNITLHHATATQLQLIAAQFGKAVDHLFICANDIGGDAHSYPTYRTVPQGSRAQYHKYLAEAGAFLCTSKAESFGIYYLELLLSGAVGVFEDQSWVRRLLPAYPADLIVEKAELLSACVALLDKGLYEKYRSQIRDIVLPLLRQEYSFDRFTKDMKAVL